MKCLYCDYVSGWDFDKNKNIEGEEGAFYKVSNDVIMKRYEPNNTCELFGCPNCKKVFMGGF